MSRIKKLTPLAAASVLCAMAFTTASPVGANTKAPRLDVQEMGYYKVDGIDTAEERKAIANSGAAIETKAAGEVTLTALPGEIEKIKAAGLNVTELDLPSEVANRKAGEKPKASTTGRDQFPSGYEDYHTYDEVNEEIRQIARNYPDIAQVFDIGQSYEGRTLYGLKISDNVSQDEGEPEVLQTCNIHAREHITTEMCMYQLNELTSKYSSDRRIKNIVDNRVLWYIPMMNPDGAMWDIRGGEFNMWRKNKQGIDLNRNWAYEWGGEGASPDPDSDTYRGRYAEEGVEVKAVADFVRSRRGQDGNKIKAHIDWHSYSELILWPFGYTEDKYVPNMDRDSYAVFEKMGRTMARTNDYKPMQSSGLYPAAGDSSDWFWGSEKIWSYTFELYPKKRFPGFYPKDDVIPEQTRRNREAVLRFLEESDCMWRVTGQDHKCQTGAINPNPDAPDNPDSPDAPDNPGTPGNSDATSFTSSPKAPINDYAIASSSVNSTHVGASKVTLKVDLSHSCLENLEIAMTTPDGSRNVVKRNGYAYRCTAWNGAKEETYTMRSKSDGNWTLEVADKQRHKTGTLNSWTIAFS